LKEPICCEDARGVGVRIGSGSYPDTKYNKYNISIVDYSYVLVKAYKKLL
jgi:hypothetical protein